MKAFKVFSTLISVFLTFPVSIYMSYLLYQHVHATDIMWFLFIIYWPLTVIAFTINAIVIAIADKK